MKPAVLILALSLVVAKALAFEITGISINESAQVEVLFDEVPESYYVLERAARLDVDMLPVAAGLEVNGGLIDEEPVFFATQGFYRVRAVLMAQPQDLDGDGIDDVYELRSGFLDALYAPDARQDYDGDGVSNLDEYRNGTDPAVPDLTTTIATSPRQGDTGVAVTRETVITFSKPLQEGTTLTSNQLYAEFGGQRLNTRIEFAKDRRTATLFYLQPLPGSARVRVTVLGDTMRDAFGKLVDADGDQREGGTGTVDYDTLSLTTVEGTAVCGRIFASELVTVAGGPNQFVNRPLGASG